MKLIKITKESANRFILELKNNFPLNELREDCDTLKLFSNPNYQPYYLEENGSLVGFVALWKLKPCYFIEHFAVFDDYKNKGYGTKALNLIIKTHKNLILEVEEPLDKLKARRIEFYKRNGFILNDFEYYQPPYRSSDEPTPLKIMSTFSVASNFSKLKSELYKTVYEIN
ncbi:MAG: GNAT family N-acetyltransferase [Clostridia bacterium]|nr:GNAT family N-acetyltransferase [Clostridia bacterium]